MKKLYEELEAYGNSDFYPFHMPGHKRNESLLGRYFPVREDITEIHGFDDLHHCDGILLDARRKAAKLFGAEETFFSVNGSTGALLASISAAAPCGSRILMARNCHKAVYHAVYLRNLRPVYVYPQGGSELGINGGISAENVEKILTEEPEIRAVILTSPTYDGVVSDIWSIAASAHKRGIPLIVDEAHGAHFPFSDYFPDSAIRMGADLVVQSVHKTLPSLTQTALLHRCTDRTDSRLIGRFLDIYETSSPSYLLMAGIDACVDLLTKRKEELFLDFSGNLSWAREQLSRNQKIRLISPEREERIGIYDYDRSKIVLSLRNTDLTGSEFHSILRERYHIELEMDALTYGLALTSVGDTREGFERLVHAVQEISQGLQEKSCEVSEERFWDELEIMESVMSITEALDLPGELCEMHEAVGKISADYIMLYPPGIPLVTPGERISRALVEIIDKCLKDHREVIGIREGRNRTELWVVKDNE